MVQISKRLVVRKEIPVENSQELIASLDVALADYYCNQKNYEKGLNIYREIIPQLPESERGHIVNRNIQVILSVCIKTLVFV